MRYLNEVYVPHSTYQEIESMGRLDQDARSDERNESSFLADYF
jgi:hypothetical protein